MPRGFEYRTYTADGGESFQTLVDRDQAADVNRGWGAIIPGGPRIPRGLKERRVLGVSVATGRSGTCRVGNTAAPLWTGGALTFDVEANDGTLDTMTVIEMHGERRIVSQ